MDDERVSLAGVRIDWGAIGSIKERRQWGRSVLRINSTNDALLIRRVPFPLNSIYWLRLRMYGAPMIVPELKGIAPDEFCALMEQHRDRAK
jgi:hypothetical protein